MKVSKELWEQSIRLYWLGSSLIGKAVGRVQYELSTHKKLKYFVVGLGIVSMVLVIWSLFTNIFQATAHAHGGFRDYNGDGKIRVSLSAGHGESTAGKRINGYTNSPYAKGDCVILMDADLQDPPELIPELIKYWEEGYDDVYARRSSRK